MSVPAAAVDDERLLPYLRLLDVAETECALAQAGHFDELARLNEERLAALRDLPDVAPAAAEDAIRRALALAAQTEQTLIIERDRIAAEMGQARHRQSVGRAYVPATGGPGPSTVDRSA
ncbi:MAG: flagellar protein FliT [Solirubrobacteraceae bacterium]|nr:flagellar protein FliT [Patulibacter sp.]